MLTTNELFDIAKARLNLVSDYALAKVLRITPASVSLHRKKPHGMDNALALKVAKAADFLPEYVLICAAAERAKCAQEKAAWKRLGAWADIRYSELMGGARPALLAAENNPEYLI